MMKKMLIVLVLGGLACMFAVQVCAEGVLKTDMSSGENVVKTRKYVMKMLKENKVSLQEQFQEDDDCALATAGAIAALAKILPPLYATAHEGVYPVEGSNKFFIPGESAVFEEKANALRLGAVGVRKALEAGDKVAAMAAYEQMNGTCGACHSVFRGQE